jgi:cytochrome c-type biogenesis protein CcmH/NrfG
MERSTQLDPKNATFFVGLGNEYRTAGRDADAGQAYERALALDLNNVEALVSLGEMRFDQGQLDWTRVLASRALRLAPQDPRVHALVGKIEQASR